MSRVALAFGIVILASIFGTTATARPNCGLRGQPLCDWCGHASCAKDCGKRGSACCEYAKKCRDNLTCKADICVPNASVPPPPPPPKSGACIFKPEAHSLGDVDLQLYVAALNHSADDHAIVDQVGVDQIAAFITADRVDPASIVLAFISSNARKWSGASGVQPPFLCEAGNKTHPDGRARNGECLAHSLETAFNVPFDIREAELDAWDGGFAVAAGSRWQISSFGMQDIQGTQFFKVVLIDRRTNKKTRIPLYIAHTSDNDQALPELTRIHETALRTLSPEDFSPIVVGDFNNSCAPAACAPAVSTFLNENYAWPNLAIHCPKQDALWSDVALDCNEKIHVLVGTRGGPTGKFGCAAGTMEAIRVNYSANREWQPIAPTRCMHFRDVMHNVIGLGFKAVPASPPVCPKDEVCRNGSCVAHCYCERPGRLCKGFDPCQNECRCKSPLVCDSGKCINAVVQCGARACSVNEGELCCFGTACCAADEQCLPRRGCVRKTRTPE